MTPEEHNKYVGYAHLGYGILSMIMLLGLGLFYVFIIFGVFFFDPKLNGNPLPGVFIVIFILGVIFFSMLFSLPSLIAGYGHLKNKTWSKVWTIVAAVLCASSFPLGTLIAVYSLWFTFGEEGRRFYEEQEKEQKTEAYRRNLNEATSFGWSAQEQTEKKDYDFSNTYQPPNWRE